MTTINEIKDRLNAIVFAGRSYAGADRAAVAQGAAISPKEAGE